VQGTTTLTTRPPARPPPAPRPALSTGTARLRNPCRNNSGLIVGAHKEDMSLKDALKAMKKDRVLVIEQSPLNDPDSDPSKVAPCMSVYTRAHGTT
jgi:hypothetical protein